MPSKSKSANSKSATLLSAGKDARILCFDIGGTGTKALLVSMDGKAIGERVRLETPNPAKPAQVFAVLTSLAETLAPFDCIACGFPGVVKRGKVLTAHNLDPEWIGFDLQNQLENRFHVPAGVANDAAVQGYGAIRGTGLELAITVGTGLGSSLFVDGVLVPGLELGHHPFREGKTYEDFLGAAGLKKYGRKRWNKRLKQAIANFERLFNYDHLYIGGGNNKNIDFDMPKNASLIPNMDGLLGGAALVKRGSILQSGAATSSRSATAPRPRRKLRPPSAV